MKTIQWGFICCLLFFGLHGFSAMADESGTIGYLIHKENRITIYSAHDGPVYSISKRNGGEIDRRLMERTLFLKYPELKALFRTGVAKWDASYIPPVETSPLPR